MRVMSLALVVSVLPLVIGGPKRGPNAAEVEAKNQKKYEAYIKRTQAKEQQSSVDSPKSNTPSQPPSSIPPIPQRPPISERDKKQFENLCNQFQNLRTEKEALCGQLPVLKDKVSQLEKEKTDLETVENALQKQDFLTESEMEVYDNIRNERSNFIKKFHVLARFLDSKKWSELEARHEKLVQGKMTEELLMENPYANDEMVTLKREYETLCTHAKNKSWELEKLKSEFGHPEKKYKCLTNESKFVFLKREEMILMGDLNSKLEQNKELCSKAGGLLAILQFSNFRSKIKEINKDFVHECDKVLRVKMRGRNLTLERVKLSVSMVQNPDSKLLEQYKLLNDQFRTLPGQIEQSNHRLEQIQMELKTLADSRKTAHRLEHVDPDPQKSLPPDY